MEAQASILVVDDSPENLQVMAAVLKEQYKVRVAINGERALALATAPEPPDLILLDVMMPGMDGPETLLKLSQRVDLNRIPVAFMTAKVQPGEIEHLRKLGAQEVIIKPFDPMRLASQIQAIWKARHP